jgi:pimeloyl-ACP methyl ester carboxylesterase
VVTEKPVAETALRSLVHSSDGVSIAYECYGGGDLTLLFVHGWSCDRSYWRQQVAFFSNGFRAVLVDLAGHGESGLGRKRHTMRAFAEDLVAVVDAIDAQRVILIGHSMGGGVIAETARLLPDRVMGLVGIDTLQDVSYSMTTEELEGMVRSLEQDFASGVRDFLSTMFVPESDEELAEWIRADMAAAPRGVAISAFREYLGQYVTGEAAEVFHDLEVPVYCLNTSSWPTAIESNRKHMSSFDVVIMENVGHFLMLEQPVRFNEQLVQIIGKICERAPPPLP